MTTSELTGILNPTEADNIPKIGFLVWSDISDERVTYDDLRQHVSDTGTLNADFIPAPTPSKGGHHAVNTFRISDYRTLVRKVKSASGAGTIRHQVTLESELKFEKELGYKATAWTIFKDGEVTVEGDDSRLKLKLTTWMNDYIKHVKREVLQAYLGYELNRFQSVVARKQGGGLTFVPVTHQESLEALQTVFEQCGSTIYAMPVFDTSTWRSNAAGFVEDDLLVDFKQISRELDGLLEEARTDGGQIKTFKLDTRLKRFADLKDKAKVYEDLLSFKATDIHEGIAKIEKRINNILTGSNKNYETVTRVIDQRKQQGIENKQARAADRAAKREADKVEAAKARSERKSLESKLTAAKKEAVEKAKPVAKKSTKTLNAPF
jgi:hypothetical protein